MKWFNKLAVRERLTPKQLDVKLINIYDDLKDISLSVPLEFKNKDDKEFIKGAIESITDIVKTIKKDLDIN